MPHGAIITGRCSSTGPTLRWAKRCWAHRQGIRWAWCHRRSGSMCRWRPSQFSPSAAVGVLGERILRNVSFKRIERLGDENDEKMFYLNCPTTWSGNVVSIPWPKAILFMQNCTLYKLIQIDLIETFDTKLPCLNYVSISGLFFSINCFVLRFANLQPFCLQIKFSVWTQNCRAARCRPAATSRSAMRVSRSCWPLRFRILDSTGAVVVYQLVGSQLHGKLGKSTNTMFEVRSSSVRSKSGSSIRSRNRIEYTIERWKLIRHKSEADGDCWLSSIPISFHMSAHPPAQPIPIPIPFPSSYLFTCLLVFLFSVHGTVTHTPPQPIPFPSPYLFTCLLVLLHMYAFPYVVLWCRCNGYPTPPHLHAHIFSHVCACPTPPHPHPHISSHVYLSLCSPSLDR